MSKRRVVITGLGLMTPCGKGWQSYWESALAARSSIRHIASLSLNGFPSKLAGEIMNFDASPYVKRRKSLKVMSREIQLAVASSYLALEDGGLLEMNETDHDRFGISLGAGLINNDIDEVGIGIKTALDEKGVFQIKKFGNEGIRALFPLWFLKYLPNMPACHISMLHGLKGPSNTITTSSAAGLQAIGESFRVIERGDADLMLTGSTDSKINAMGISRFHLLGLLSIRNHTAPEHVYCPFDEKHDGIVLGEGAGLLVLEEYEHAKKRGAKIYAEISGFGSGSDYNYDPRSTSDFYGKKVAMQRAIDDARVSSNDVDVIVANGCGVPQQDVQEVQAIHEVFSGYVDRMRVTGLKPVAGHMIYGSGGVEAATSAIALSEQILPPLINFENPAGNCDLPFVRKSAQKITAKTLMVNSFGFCGQNASLVLKKV